MGEWQPIETAPRDGVGLITYAATETNRVYRGRVEVIAAYFDEDGRVCDYSTCKPDVGIVNGFWKASHWMPLPPPPVQP